MKLSSLNQFFQENNGQFSSVRAQTWLVILCFCADWIVHIVRDQAFVPDISIVGVVLGVLGLKVTQKFAEDKPQQ
ncbi:MAG: hypothetical protein EWV49_13590 [Microcystis aeruginosa Ma_QC_Ch_20071001_S25]|uniref:Uncharacterized protein n=1 Tax=Microcystis aeruginosa Ma_QC_Ch_20071001_S25D TaxID=2486250 RepID=A0A552G6W5_MICAE|nr:MAG: hypothetical protein EWV49_13590 [Microcystis aeruginosa Ma_QC_Ch_20071001_S25]TRU54627.1 MAG: hypothetical protein EWV57_01190 [Microcystis aeruginosa Ma_QC_Ch_20071001_S25D]TRU56332.1 MAG: hypothetical protein EWV90_22935 [Microcystis aeruginosa Ma_QC_Ch_20071001_M135]